MTEIRFYHLQKSTLEAALPPMLEKTLERGQRAVVIAGSPERVEALTSYLWTYNDRGFLPHGSARDGFSRGAAGCWLTEKDENPNGAQVLFLTDGAASGHVADFALCVELLDGNDENSRRRRPRPLARIQSRRPQTHLLAAKPRRQMGAEGRGVE